MPTLLAEETASMALISTNKPSTSLETRRHRRHRAAWKASCGRFDASFREETRKEIKDLCLRPLSVVERMVARSLLLMASHALASTCKIFRHWVDRKRDSFSGLGRSLVYRSIKASSCFVQSLLLRTNLAPISLVPLLVVILPIVSRAKRWASAFSDCSILWAIRKSSRMHSWSASRERIGSMGGMQNFLGGENRCCCPEFLDDLKIAFAASRKRQEQPACRRTSTTTMPSWPNRDIMSFTPSCVSTRREFCSFLKKHKKKSRWVGLMVPK